MRGLPEQFLKPKPKQRVGVRGGKGEDRAVGEATVVDAGDGGGRRRCCCCCC